MSSRFRVGLALEHGSEQFLELAEPARRAVGFVEYGCQLHRGIPGWVGTLRKGLGAGMVLHPLDVNVAGQERWDDGWAERMAGLVAETGAEALVTDLGLWYHGERRAMWARPPWMGTSGRTCREVAAEVAARCGVAFRVENPPLEWMPGEVSLWRFLEEASDDGHVELCLDLSHLIQFNWNVHGRGPDLPRDFPWHRVTELHLAGYVVVEYQGQRRYIDRHAAEIDDEQLDLVVQALERIGSARRVDICLEMENRAAVSYEATLERLLTRLGAPAAR